MIYTIHASQNENTIEAESVSVVITVARARCLIREGWDVRITTKLGLTFFADEFDALLLFDPHA